MNIQIEFMHEGEEQIVEVKSNLIPAVGAILYLSGEGYSPKKDLVVQKLVWDVRDGEFETVHVICQWQYV